MTFSIVARCARTGQLGIAIATAVPAAAPLSVHLKSGIGAIASQAWVNPYLGIDGLDLLAKGGTAQAVLDQIIRDDPGRASRQVGIVDGVGRAAAFTGNQCPPWCGHRSGEGYTVQGNLLIGAETVASMADSAEASTALPLDERLMRALEAGQAAGGDRRGRQSAALAIVEREDYRLVDLRVDDHTEPVAELRRLLEVSRVQVLPLITGLPKRGDPIGQMPATVLELLGRSPRDRPQVP